MAIFIEKQTIYSYSYTYFLSLPNWIVVCVKVYALISGAKIFNFTPIWRYEEVYCAAKDHIIRVFIYIFP